MPSKISETLLPNGMKVFCFKEEEASILYEQIQEYLKNGIKLNPGDCLFDIGANIGLFSLYSYQVCNNNLNIYAFEPIPAIFNILKANAQRFNPGQIKVLPYGLGKEAKQTTFAWCPNASMLSTEYKDNLPELKQELKTTMLRNFNETPTSIRRLVWLPPFIRSFFLDKALEKAFQIKEVSCELRTISEIIELYNIQNIDLLKVDVEKSELDVLLGIKDKHWTKIKQIVIEIHDLEKRVETIKNLLEQRGFNQIKVEQEPLLKGSELFNLYALR